MKHDTWIASLENSARQHEDFASRVMRIFQISILPFEQKVVRICKFSSEGSLTSYVDLGIRLSINVASSSNFLLLASSVIVCGWCQWMLHVFSLFETQISLFSLLICLPVSGGGSVVDYVFMKACDLSMVNAFKIGPTSSYSNHKPLYLNLTLSHY